MKYAMEFLSGGYFIHDAPWRSAYGPGTNGSNGTHGCINTPRSAGQMDFLYNWADMGTTVVVLAGDFGSHP
jgi:lipoprotein-anchoring transpeptidase ErfK/SrfK